MLIACEKSNISKTSTQYNLIDSYNPLDEVKNIDFEWYSPSGELDFITEPGFANWRFEPKTPLRKKRKVVQIEILPQIKETLYKSPQRRVKENLELA